jgi:CSLREA domain-containing protein
LLVWFVVLGAAPAAWASTFTVTRIDDPVPGTCDLGDCSLREAIIAANINPGADVIVLGSGLTYTLSNGPADLPAALTEASGDLDIRDSVTINGNGSTVTAVGLTGAKMDRVFHIAGASVVVTINSLTIKNGRPSGFLSLGGGLYVRDASVTLNNCTVTENTTAVDATADDGGGIAVVGTFVAPTATLAHLTLDRTTVLGNAGLNGGGIVCVLCELAVRNNSVIQGNVATDTDGGGIVVVGDASDVSIAKSTIAGNQVSGPVATRNGGGLSVPAGASVPRLAFNRIVNNFAGATGAISTASGSVTAQNNWWGCNFGAGTSGVDCPAPPNGVSGGVVTAPFLVLKGSSSPAMIPRNGHAIATADLTVNSINANTSGLGSLANTAVAFGGGPGTFQFPTVLTTNGKANDDFTATTSGLANLTATLDGQTVRFTQLVNSAPAVSQIANQTINEDTSTAALAFTISDDDGNPMTLSASATTNPTLISAIVLGGAGASRTVTITPVPNRPLAAPSDAATITIAVSDGLAVTLRSFVLTVNAVNDAPTLTAFVTPAPIAEDAPAQTMNLSGISAGGGEAQILTVTATSSNPGLIPNPTVNYVSASATGSLTYTPVANASGTAVISVTVRDNGGTASGGVDAVTRVFTVVVAPVADTPSITNASTAFNTQTTSGLVVSRNPADGSEVTHVRVTNITGGTLFKHDGVTPIANGAFITFAEGAAGLRFTPASNSAATGHVTIQASTSGAITGLGGATVTADIIVNARSVLTGADAGGAPHARRFVALGGSTPAVGALSSFFAFDPSFSGGVRVAEGDLNGDGIPDYVIGAGPGAAPEVRIVDGAFGTISASIVAFEPAFHGGVFVAAGDVNGDGHVDAIVSSGDGRRGEIKVFSGRDLTLIRDVFVFDVAFTGGVHVAAGDVNGDGYADLVAGGGAGGAEVLVLNGIDLSLLWSVTPYPGFFGGAWVAAGDVTGDGFADVVTGAGAGGGPHVKVFDGRTGAMATNFFAFDPSFTGGVRVAAGDVNGDGHAEIIAGAGPGGLAEVRVFDPVTTTLLSNVLAYTPAFAGGVFVATAVPVNRMAVDTPPAGATVHGPFYLAGWAFDEHPSAAGLDAIHVWAFPVAGGSPVFAGAATLGVSRPDVAAFYGAQYANAGFYVNIAGLAPGVYDLVLFGHGSVSGTYNVQRLVRVTIVP